MKIAYLKTKQVVDYKDCEIQYYTYFFPKETEVFYVNVNTVFNDFNNYTHSLSLDEKFDEEEEAIEYGIAEGKAFIDKTLEKRKFARTL